MWHWPTSIHGAAFIASYQKSEQFASLLTNEICSQNQDHQGGCLQGHRRPTPLQDKLPCWSLSWYIETMFVSLFHCLISSQYLMFIGQNNYLFIVHPPIHLFIHPSSAAYPELGRGARTLIREAQASWLLARRSDRSTLSSSWMAELVGPDALRRDYFPPLGLLVLLGH